MNIVELLFLVMLGFFVFSRFFSIKLPTDEGKPEAKIIPLKTVKKKDVNVEHLEGLDQIKAADRDFKESDFKEGSLAAFKMYHEAVTDDDEDLLEDLLSPKLFDEYLEQAEKLDDAQERVAFKVKAVDMEILDARLSGRTAIIDVKYKAEIAQAILSLDGQEKQGNLDDFQSIEVIWTWARSIDAEDLNWELESVSTSQ